MSSHDLANDAQFQQLGNEIAAAAVAAVNTAVDQTNDHYQPGRHPESGEGPQTFGAGLFDPRSIAKQLAITLVPLLISAIADRVPGISTIELSNYVISKINELL